VTAIHDGGNFHELARCRRDLARLRLHLHQTWCGKVSGRDGNAMLATVRVREGLPAYAGHDRRSAVRGYVRNTWNWMRSGGGADIRIGSDRARRCGWLASARMEECPQIRGSHTTGDGASCSA
jgi:hypothetical protein